MTDQPTPENVESETDLSYDLQRTVVGSVPGVGNMGVSTTGTAPLNPAALEEAFDTVVNQTVAHAAMASGDSLTPEESTGYVKEIARVSIETYLAALPIKHPSLMFGPRFSDDRLRELRRIVESGTPLARNTVLQLIETAFMEATN